MMTVKNTLMTACAVFTLGGCVSATKAVLSPSSNTSNLVTSAKCPGSTPPSQALLKPVDRSNFDQQLFDESVRYYSNQRRCANGLKPLSGDSGLRQAAAGHSADMARLKFLAHDSPVAGKSKFTDRIKLAGVSYRRAAENLARGSRLQIEPGKSFITINRTACEFSYEPNGARIQPHSYQSLGKEMVEQWESSPGHRKNLFSPKYTRLGSGGAHSTNQQTCGDIYATQNFAA